MNFKRQLRGLRWRVLCVVVAFGLGAGLTFYYHIEVFRLLMRPAGGLLSPSGKLVFTSPTEIFSVTLDLTVKGGIVVAFPVAIFQLYGFIAPLLGAKPRRLVRIYLLLASFLYLAGAAFAYFVLLPAALQFLLNFGGDVAYPLIRISDYLTLALTMLFWLGIVFELPLLMMLLAHLRLVNHRQFKKLRKWVPLSAFILAMFTPGVDMVTSQFLVAMPLIALYEFGIVLAFLVRPKAKPTPTS